MLLNYFTASIVGLSTEQQLSSEDDSPSFRNLIETNQTYVDKTKYFDFIIEKDSYERYSFEAYVRLTRPKGFGKTLLVDTMYEFFKGEKDLFKDIYIYKKYPNYQWPKYPIIRLECPPFQLLMREVLG